MAAAALTGKARDASAIQLAYEGEIQSLLCILFDGLTFARDSDAELSQRFATGLRLLRRARSLALAIIEEQPDE